MRLVQVQGLRQQPQNPAHVRPWVFALYLAEPVARHVNPVSANAGRTSQFYALLK